LVYFFTFWYVVPKNLATLKQTKAPPCHAIRLIHANETGTNVIIFKMFSSGKFGGLGTNFRKNSIITLYS
jgi:hypothetical protein